MIEDPTTYGGNRGARRHVPGGAARGPRHRSKVMKKNAVALMCAVCAVVALWSTEAVAGPYSDEMAKCLVRSTTSTEKNGLIKWIFAAAALHPEVKGISSITEAQR